jgi:hypothetical protein
MQPLAGKCSGERPKGGGRGRCRVDGASVQCDDVVVAANLYAVMAGERGRGRLVDHEHLEASVVAYHATAGQEAADFYVGDANLPGRPPRS